MKGWEVMERGEKLQWKRKAATPESMNASGCDYSDRLVMMDIAKYSSLSQKYFGDQSQWFNMRDAAKIEAFLAEYNGFSLVLTHIIQGEDSSSGHPYWLFTYVYEI